jgi:ABC-type lipoprotein export system ATPase subunit
MNNDSCDFLKVSNITKNYEHNLVTALRGISFTVAKAERVAIMGPSGCGKSTLLAIIGALDVPTGGEVLVAGIPVKANAVSYRFRAGTIGFVFQFHHLIPSMTLSENVESPLISSGIPRQERRKRAIRLLSEIGLEHRAHFLPGQVSGGERQRAAIARALINSPPLILADEPTGNLDTATGEAAINLLFECAAQSKSTVIIATHNPEIAARADRIITMRDGLLSP